MNIKGKKLLILGATSETGKLVQKAECLGVETYVVDPYVDAAAKKISSHPIDLDCFDVDRVCELVEKEHIDGILPGCADILVSVYEMVCSRTNKYCYVNKKIVDVFNNKRGMKDTLVKYGLPVVNEYTKEEVEASAFDSFPIFVKPADNNSSKGMSIVYSISDFEVAYAKAMEYSKSNTVLIEDYMNCDDFYIGYFLQDGNVRVAFTGDRFVINQKGVGSITSAISYPSKYSELYYDTIHDKMLQIFQDLEFANGICAIQGFVKDGKIMFYDPALRITGGQEYILIDFFTGVNELQALISFALTGKISEKDIYKMCDSSYGGKVGCNLTFSAKECTIGRIEGIDYARNHKRVINITQEHLPGDRIDKIGTAQQNYARMHLYTDSVEEMRELISDLQMHVKVYNEAGENVVLEGLNPEKWYAYQEE